MPNAIRFLTAALWLAFLCALSGCGGGGGGASSDAAGVSSGNEIAPPVLMVGTVSDQSVGLAWSPVGNALYYKVFRDGVELSTTQPLQLAQLEDSGLIANTAYLYSAQACDSTRCSARSNSLSVHTSAPVTAKPDVLTNLQVTMVTESSVRLQWRGNSATAYYELYRDGAQIANGAHWVSSYYLDTELISDAVYSYQIKACNRLGCSAPSAASTAQTLARAEQAPSRVPTPLVVATSSSSVTLQWSPISGASYYKVWRSTTVDASDSTLLTGLQGETVYQDANLPANTFGLYYAVAACNSAGCSAASSLIYAWYTYVSASPHLALRLTGLDTSRSSTVSIKITTSTGANYYQTLYRNVESSNTDVMQGQTYTVSVLTQPNNGQTCTVSPVSSLTLGTSTQIVEIDCHTPTALSFSQNQVAISADTPAVRPQSLLASNAVTGALITVPLVYKSSNEKIARVDPVTGVVSALATGQVTITAQLNSPYHRATNASAPIYTLQVLNNTTPVRVARIEYAQVRSQIEGDSDYMLLPNRAMLLRVYVQSKSSASVSQFPLTLTASVGAQRLSVPLTCPPTWTAAAVGSLLYQLDATCHARIDASYVQPGMRLAVAPSNMLLTGPHVSTAPTFAKRAHLNLTLVPVVVNGVTASLPSDDEVRTVLKRSLPFASFSIQRHPAWTPSGTFHSNLNGTSMTDCNRQPDEWNCVLSQLAALRQSEGSTDTYFGFIPFVSSAVSQGQSYTAGLAYVGAPAGLGFDRKYLEWGARLMAHEIGHTLSLSHAPCGGALNPDANFSFGLWYKADEGWLDNAPLYDQIADVLIDPKYASGNDTGYGTDIMGYCDGTWFSRYSYNKASTYINDLTLNAQSFTAPSTTSAAVVAANALQTAASTPAASNGIAVLNISGRIAKGQAWLSPIDAQRTGEPTSSLGPYALRITDAKGQVLVWNFDVLTIDHDDSEQHFFVRVPTVAAITRVAIFKNGVELPLHLPQSSAPTTAAAVQQQSLPQTKSLSVGAGNTPAGWSRLQEQANQIQLSWDSANYPWLTVTHIAPGGRRTVLLWQVQGGVASTQTTDLVSGGAFELLLSNGLNSTSKLVPRSR